MAVHVVVPDQEAALECIPSIFSGEAGEPLCKITSTAFCSCGFVQDMKSQGLSLICEISLILSSKNLCFAEWAALRKALHSSLALPEDFHAAVQVASHHPFDQVQTRGEEV